MRPSRIGACLLLIVAAATFACVTDTASLDRFTRVDVLTDGFTKHFKESLFAVSKRRLYSVELLFDGGVPKAGLNNLFLIIHDSHDRDVEGAELRISTQYVGHSVGTDSGTPRIIEKYGGLYKAEAVSLGEPGRWVLSVTVVKDSTEDTAVFDLPDVPRP